MFGAVRSMLRLFTLVDAELPAMSRHVPVTDCPEPSPRVLGEEKLDRPDRLSEHTKLIVRVTLYQPFGFGSEDWELVIIGGVLSMLIPPIVPEAEFPALSVQEADLD